jgi:predicted acyltransferase
MKNAETNKRLMSLDALRGFDMLFISGLSGLIMAICKLFPNGSECWLHNTMKHVKWDGIAHHDTIFPLFLFIAGVSFPFSYAKQQENGLSRKSTYWKIIRRTLTLIILGIIYNGFFKLDFENLRICSVLGRIGLAWGIAAILFINFKPAARAIISGVILIGYWLVVCYIPAPDVPGGDPLTMQGSIVGWVDRMITPGRLIYDGGRFDPEGLLSTLPAVVTALLGMFTGEFLRIPDSRINGTKKAGYMGLAALGLLAAGLLWSLVFPLNKMLWSSSFVLVVGSYSLAMMALFYFIIDVKGWKKWAFPLTVVGLNSITIYLLPRIISISGIVTFFLGGLMGYLPEAWAKVVSQAGFLAVCWLAMYFLYKKKVFLKI